MRHRIAVLTGCLLGAVCAGIGSLMAQGPAGPPRAASAEAGDKSGITAGEAWARATPEGAKVGAIFIELRAAAGVADRLLAASSPAAGVVELHDHIRDGAMAKMRRVDAIPIAAGQTVKLQPGGLHIMLMDLKGALVAGETVKLSLTFEKAGVVEVEAKIAPVGAMSLHGGLAAPGHSSHGAAPAVPTKSPRDGAPK